MNWFEDLTVDPIGDAVRRYEESMEIAEVGDLIEIVEMVGEPQYKWKQGVVQYIDDIGQLHGTWGGLAVTDGDLYIVLSKRKN